MCYHPVSIVWQCPLNVSAYLALGQQIEVTEPVMMPVSLTALFVVLPVAFVDE